MWIRRSDTVIPNLHYGALKKVDESVLEVIITVHNAVCAFVLGITEQRGEKKSMFVRPHVALTTAMDTCQGDYHKFCFCRDVLGIEECREEIITICGRQRISHSAVCCCFSVFEGDVRKKWKCLGGWGWRKGGGGGGALFPKEEKPHSHPHCTVLGWQTMCQMKVRLTPS